MRATAAQAQKDEQGAPKATLFVLVWAVSTLIWSIFTPPHKTFAARILLFQPLWGVRMYLKEATWVQDLALFLVLHALYSLSTGAWRLVTFNDLAWFDLNNSSFRIYLQIFSLLGICGFFAGGIVHRGHQLKDTDEDERLPERRIDEQLLPPLLITSRTTHSRLFPRKNAFSYSYLFVGVPVGFRGAIGSTLSVDTHQHGWFHVNSADYLSRSSSQQGLAEKLKRYLHTQGVTDRDYAFAYLVTAPRFLGYSFNPVSFWYLYDSDAVLKYMILEVNNTFDERRMYLLRADKAKTERGADSSASSDDDADDIRKKLVFSETWDKDFHVSPFNSRKGSYSLKAIDPLAAYQETGHVSIDNTIVLRSSKDSPKLTARVRSEGMPKEAKNVTPLELARFIAAWWWVGFCTFPRIVWEAQKLFFTKKLHVWYRPEVAETSISRTYTADERHLESFFHAFLEQAVRKSESPLRVVYEPAHADGEEIVMYSPGFTYEEDHKRTLVFKIQSPAFYSRFVHYAHAKEAFDRECLATDEKNQTLIIETPSLLPTLLNQMDKFRGQHTQKPKALDQVRWSLLRRLRCPAPPVSYPEGNVQNTDYTITDIRSFQRSELDGFVESSCEDINVYQRICMKIFLAQRFALGTPPLMALADWALRATILAAAMHYCDHPNAVDIFRPRQLGVADIYTLCIMMLMSNTIHVWSFVKG